MKWPRWRTPDVRPLGERLRGYVGGRWHEMGQLQLSFLIENGLAPDHVLLDIGCGSLRLGVRAVPYLDAGSYLGLDVAEFLIEHGKNVELGATLLRQKQPEFVVSGAFGFGEFSRLPDFAIAHSLFTHLTEADIALCLKNLARHRRHSTVLYATFFETERPVENLPASHPHLPFRYTQSELGKIAAATGWRMEYIGDWAHPGGQKMLRFRPADDQAAPPGEAP